MARRMIGNKRPPAGQRALWHSKNSPDFPDPNLIRRPWAVLKKSDPRRSHRQPPRPKGPTPTAWCQTPKDTPRDPVSMLTGSDPIRLVLSCPMDALGNSEPKTTPWAFCHISLAMPEQFLRCGSVHCPVEKATAFGDALAMMGDFTVCNSVWVGGLCQLPPIWGPKVSQQKM